MADHINTVQLSGVLTKDAEIRESKAGRKYANLNIRNERSYEAKGETRTDKLFMRAVVFGPKAEMADGLREGDEVIVSGRLQSNSYEKEGERRWVIDLIATDIETPKKSSSKKKKQDDEPDLDEIPF